MGEVYQEECIPTMYTLAYTPLYTPWAYTTVHTLGIHHLRYTLHIHHLRYTLHIHHLGYTSVMGTPTRVYLRLREKRGAKRPSSSLFFGRNEAKRGPPSPCSLREKRRKEVSFSLFFGRNRLKGGSGP